MDMIDLKAIEADAKRKWASDPKMQAEFVDESSYVAFRKAEAKGLFHILGQPREQE